MATEFEDSDSRLNITPGEMCDDPNAAELRADFYFRLCRKLRLIAVWANNKYGPSHMDLDDIVQEAALKLFDKIENNKYTEDVALKVASTVVCRLIFTSQRANLRYINVLYQLAIYRADESVLANQDYVDLEDEIAFLTSTFSDEEKHVFEKRLTGVPIRDIADQLECSRTKVTQIIARLTDRLANSSFFRGASE